MGDLRTRAAQATDAAMRSPSAESIGAAVDAAVAAQAEMPDVQDSGVPADMDASVYIAWSRVMADVQWVGKGRSPGLNYEFRGIDAVLNAVGPALRKHGVSVVQVGVRPVYNTMSTKGGHQMRLCQVTVDYAVFGPRGDRFGGDDFVLQSAGEAFDSGDKATPKAQSVALRTFYINSLAIPTNQPEMDPEHGKQYELAAPPPPTATEYHKEIVAPGTSLARLRQIRAELSALPALAQTEVEEIDGERIQLIKLVTRVGTERAQKS